MCDQYLYSHNKSILVIGIVGRIYTVDVDEFARAERSTHVVWENTQSHHINIICFYCSLYT